MELITHNHLFPDKPLTWRNALFRHGDTFYQFTLETAQHHLVEKSYFYLNYTNMFIIRIMQELSEETDVLDPEHSYLAYYIDEQNHYKKLFHVNHMYTKSNVDVDWETLLVDPVPWLIEHIIL